MSLYFMSSRVQDKAAISHECFCDNAGEFDSVLLRVFFPVSGDHLAWTSLILSISLFLQSFVTPFFSVHPPSFSSVLTPVFFLLSLLFFFLYPLSLTHPSPRSLSSVFNWYFSLSLSLSETFSPIFSCLCRFKSNILFNIHCRLLYQLLLNDHHRFVKNFRPKNLLIFPYSRIGLFKFYVWCVSTIIIMKIIIINNNARRRSECLLLWLRIQKWSSPDWLIFFNIFFLHWIWS